MRTILAGVALLPCLAATPAFAQKSAEMTLEGRIEALEKDNAFLREQLRLLLDRSTQPVASRSEPVSAPAPVSPAPTVSASAPSQKPTWSGGYIGVSLGGQQSTLTRFARTSTSGTASPTGFALGSQVGYRWQHDHVVAGIELAVRRTYGQQADFVLSGARTDRIVFDAAASVKGQIGFALGNWLVYGTTGIEMALVNRADIRNPTAFPEVTEHTPLTGLTYGAGVGYKLGFGPSIELEYTQTNFGVVPSQSVYRVKDELLLVRLNQQF